jgi:tetratricopeptide (TPR) repeat protein
VKLPPILLKALHEKEAEVTAARREAIGLIESYLRDSPHSKEQAEALYKLAELYWEESKAVYLEKMGKYQEAVTACHNDRAQCPRVPRKPPSVDLAQAQAVYLRLINNYPKFRKIDTVIYLYAFSLRDQGKTGESIKYFQIILDRYPRSRYIADAWMAIAEFRFYEQQNYKSSLEAYEKVLAHPKSQLYDLALFKTAWCYWKLGDTNKSALRFKDVLDLAKKKAGRTEEQQKRAAELQGQALDYLVELFTEDDTKSAHDAFEFLAQIGGKRLWLWRAVDSEGEVVPFSILDKRLSEQLAAPASVFSVMPRVWRARRNRVPRRAPFRVASISDSGRRRSILFIRSPTIRTVLGRLSREQKTAAADLQAVNGPLAGIWFMFAMASS